MKAWLGGSGQHSERIDAAEKHESTPVWVEMVEIKDRTSSTGRALVGRAVRVALDGNKSEKLHQPNKTDSGPERFEKADPKPVEEVNLDGEKRAVLTAEASSRAKVTRFLAELTLNPEPRNKFVFAQPARQQKNQWLDRVSQHHQCIHQTDFTEFKKLVAARIASGGDTYWLRVKHGLNLFVDNQRLANKWPLIEALYEVLADYAVRLETARRVFVEHFVTSAEAETTPDARLNRLKELFEIATDGRYPDLEVVAHAVRFAEKVLFTIRTPTDLKKYLSLVKCYRSKGPDSSLRPDKEFNTLIAAQKANLQWYRQIDRASEAIQENPGDALAYCDRGNAYAELGSLNEAIADFTQAIELQPNYAFAYCRRGNLNDDLGLYEDAKADYDEGIRLGKRDATTHNNRGVVKEHLGLWEEAKSDYTESIRLDRNYVRAYLNRGCVEHRLGRYREAIGDYDRAIKKNSYLVRAYHHRARANEQLGRNEEAAADRARAHRLDPSTY